MPSLERQLDYHATLNFSEEEFICAKVRETPITKPSALKCLKYNFPIASSKQRNAVTARWTLNSCFHSDRWLRYSTTVHAWENMTEKFLKPRPADLTQFWPWTSYSSVKKIQHVIQVLGQLNIYCAVSKLCWEQVKDSHYPGILQMKTDKCIMQGFNTGNTGNTIP